MPGRMLLVTADNGTRFKFSTAVKSSCVSGLPHFGQRPPKTLNFGFRLVFMLNALKWPNYELYDRLCTKLCTGAFSSPTIIMGL